MGYVLAAYALVLSCLAFYGLSLAAERARLSGRSTLLHRIVAFALAGLLLGGLVGILLRPSAPAVGPVPLDAVFSRGRGPSAAEPFDAGEADRAFNGIVLASLIGAAAGGSGAWLLAGRSRPPP